MRNAVFMAALVTLPGLCFLAPASGQDKKPGGGKVAALGEAAPAFSLKDQDGKDVKLSDFKGKIVVLQWTDPACPSVVRHYQANTFQDLNVKWQPKGVVHLAVHTGGTVDSIKRFHERHK